MTVIVGKVTVEDCKVDPNLSPMQLAQMKQFIRASAIVWQAERDGKCLCIWGLMPPTISSNVAYMWFHIVEYVEQLEFLIVRHSKKVIENALKEYPVIVGHCQRENERAIRWMKWLGAKFEHPEYDFVPFRIERKDG